VEEAVNSASDFDIRITDDVGQVRRTQHLDGSWDWFQRLWGIAVIAHIVGNPARGQLVGDVTALGVLSFVTGLTAVAAILRPDDRRLLWALAVAIPITAWLETPILSNHWLLASLISLALVASRLFRFGWSWFAATSRAMLLAFYGFAVLAKINTDFFEPSVSCAVVYANQSLRALGLPGAPVDSALATALPFLVVAIEAAIPILLLRARTRYVGLMVALVFHVIVSFDFGQHFYDFTAVLLPLLLLWIADDRLERLGEYLPERTQFVAGMTLSMFVVASVLPVTRLTSALLDDGIFLVWVPLALGSIGYAAFQHRGSHQAAFRPPNGLAWIFVAVVVVNGLSPYAEVKTANSWNMYSNLAVVNGESNHLLMRSGIPFGDGHGELVEVVATNDPGLSRYVGSNWRLSQRTLGAYLTENSGSTVEVRISGVEHSGELALPQSNLLVRRLMVLRAVDASPPQDCQTVWLPAN
jgi:hypothetical protein